MSAEKFSVNHNYQQHTTDRLRLVGKKIAASAVLSGSLATGIGLGLTATAEAMPAGHHIVHQEVDPNGNEVIIVGGTNDQESVNMPGYEAMLPKGVYSDRPERIRYRANMFTYDISVNEGAQRVREAIERAPIGTRIFIIGQSQGADAAERGTALALSDQPERAGQIDIEAFGDPNDFGGAFDAARANPVVTALMGMGGVTVPPPFPDIAARINRHCIRADAAGNGPNDSVCNTIGDPLKIARDWNETHPFDLPNAFQ